MCVTSIVGAETVVGQGVSSQEQGVSGQSVGGLFLFVT